MNKSVIGVIGLIITIIVIVVVAGIAIYINTDNNHEENTNSAENTNMLATENTIGTENNNTINSKNKILVVYFSAQNHTKSVAERIAKNLNADIFEIVPEDVYTSDDLNWNNSNSRVSKEHDDEFLRNVKLKNTKVNNWEEYDTILIGYPIWWGIAAWPVNTFVKENNFEGKTVIPFCTSASSSLGQSGELLQKEANSGNWKEGHRFSSSASDSDIQKWTDSIK